MRPLPLLCLLGLLCSAASCNRASSPDPCPPDMVNLAPLAVELGHPKRTMPWQIPPHSTSLPRFCIDRFEYPNIEGTLPRVNVTWDEADTTCRERGRRLCSSDEWERACRGPQSWEWSYGPSFDPERCNTPRVGADGPVGTSPPLAAAGSLAGCRSPEGVADLNGNVSEWVADSWDGELHGSPDWKTLAQALDEPAVVAAALSAPLAQYRSLRGGTMWSETFYGQSCHSHHAHPRGSPADDDGFRCCLIP